MTQAPQLRHLGPALGTEVLGIDLSKPLEEGTFTWIQTVSTLPGSSHGMCSEMRGVAPVSPCTSAASSIFSASVLVYTTTPEPCLELR